LTTDTAVSISPSTEEFDYGPILAAARLLVDAKVDIIGWPGTSAGWLGFEHDERLCAVIVAATGINTTTSILSLNAIFRELCCTTFGLISPYTEDITDRIRLQYEDAGTDIKKNWSACLGLTNNDDIAMVDESTLDRMMAEINANGAHVLSTFCTNWRAAQRVAYWEKALKCTVADALSSLIWGMLKATDVDTRLVKGWGFIFEVD
jgi:maleate isomerase